MGYNIWMIRIGSDLFRFTDPTPCIVCNRLKRGRERKIVEQKKTQFRPVSQFFFKFFNVEKLFVEHDRRINSTSWFSD